MPSSFGPASTSTTASATVPLDLASTSRKSDSSEAQARPASSLPSSLPLHLSSSLPSDVEAGPARPASGHDAGPLHEVEPWREAEPLNDVKPLSDATLELFLAAASQSEHVLLDGPSRADAVSSSSSFSSSAPALPSGPSAEPVVPKAVKQRRYDAALRAHFLAEGRVPLLGAVDLLGASRQAWSGEDKFSMTFYRSVIAGLRLLARLLELEEVDPGLNRESMNKGLRHLPLFWTAREAQTWRAGGYETYWNGCSKGDQKRYRATLEDASNPWEAFHCPWSEDNPGQGKIWGHWLENVPCRELRGVVLRSLELFESAMQVPELVAATDTLTINVGRVAHRLGLSSKQASMWKVWLGTRHQGFAVQDVLALACERASYEEYEMPRWFDLLATALGGSPNDVDQLFGRATSPLALAGLLTPRLSDAKLPAGGRGRLPAFPEVFGMHNSRAVDVWFRRYDSDAAFLANFVRVSPAQEDAIQGHEPENESKNEPEDEPGDTLEGSTAGSAHASVRAPLTVASFAHLHDEVERLVAALSGPRPVKVLLWGTPGSGKTQLAHVLLTAAGKVVAEPGSTHTAAPPSTINRSVDVGQTRLSEVAIAQRMAPMLGDAGLLVDECEALLNNTEHKWSVNQSLDQAVLAQVWVANDLEGIHPAYLRRFDAVLHVPPMPLWAREKLAASLFTQNAALAQRVAQAMHTPAEVVRAHQWCQSVGRFDWATVSTRMAGYQRALMAAAKDDLDETVVTVVTPSLNEGGLSNLAGYPELRRAAQELTHVFSHPEHYKRLGAKVPRGVLLAGEPGTGKTLFARSVASEVGVPMVMADASSLADVPSRIGHLFNEARKHAPCMVFLDEIDALASNVRGPDGSLSTEKQKILNRLLVELDGFEPLDGVMVVAATHRADALDPAITRSGRLGRTVRFRRPNAQDRAQIWRHHTAGMPLASAAGAAQAGATPSEMTRLGAIQAEVTSAPDVDWDRLAQASAGFSGADIAQAANMAALDAALHERPAVSETDLHTACDRVFWGDSDGGLPMSDEEKWGTAVHEAGHALIALKNGVHVERITVRPRATFLGAVHWAHDEGKHSLTPQDLNAQLDIAVGGIAAEAVMLGNYGNGGENDLEQAHGLLRRALQQWGMGSTLGTSALGNTVSEETLMALEHEERTRMQAVYGGVSAWLTGHREALDALARHLLDVREMSGGQVRAWVDARADRLA